MELFPADSSLNLLPHDGQVRYFGPIMAPDTAEKYLQRLLQGIAWKNDEAYIFGKHFITKRKVAWYGDQDYSYTYSNATRQALPWTPDLLALKVLAEMHSGSRYNSCLLNLYHDGNEGMAWHSDDEKALGKNSAIASVSFGAERKFAFKHKRSGETVSLLLEPGSLLVMEGETQTHWLHRLPKSTRVTRPRVNLTFRTMVTSHPG